MQRMGGNIHEFLRNALIALFLSIEWIVEVETEIRIGSKLLFGDIAATNGSISVLPKNASRVRIAIGERMAFPQNGLDKTRPFREECHAFKDEVYHQCRV